MKKFHFKVALILIAVSALIYILHWFLFRDVEHISIFFVSDLAFLPVEVFLVTLIIDKGIQKREQEHIMEKMNMIIGLFFSEIGRDMIRMFSEVDLHKEDRNDEFVLINSFYRPDFNKIIKWTKEHEQTVDVCEINLLVLKNMLNDKRDFFSTLMANSAVLEHDTFSELLYALFHLQEGLNNRNILEMQCDMHKFDIQQLNLDIERVYKLLAIEWVMYMKHLNEKYRYLYYTALTQNPYDSRPTKEIEEKVNNYLLKKDRRHKTGDRRQRARDRRQETRDRKPETGDRRQGIGDRRQETGNRRQETEDRRQEARDWKQN